MKRAAEIAVLAAYFYVAYRYVNWYCPRNPALDDGGMWHVKYSLVTIAVYLAVCVKHRFQEPFLAMVFWGTGLLVAAWGVSAHFYRRAAAEGWFPESSVAGTELIDRFSSDLTSSATVIAGTLGLVGFYFVSRAVQNKESGR